MTLRLSQLFIFEKIQQLNADKTTQMQSYDDAYDGSLPLRFRVQFGIFAPRGVWQDSIHFTDI